MRKKIVLFLIIFLIIMFAGITKRYAADQDRIVNYEVKVDPRMNDGSLDITYNITWRVLDSTTDGPLTWVQIGTPNNYFDSATALSNTIKSINKYNGSFVRIDFKRAYYAGEEVTFKYSIHQPYMYDLGWFGKVNYKFTPAWFTDIKIDSISILWNADSVKSNDSKTKEGNYLIWNKIMLDKGEKITANISYDKSAFGSLSSNMQTNNVKKTNNSLGSFSNIIGVFMIVCIIIVVISSLSGGGGYYGNRGFYSGGYYSRGFYGGCAHSSCAHSSCACAHSSCAHSSCACACAGSGRAGCSLKDFYRTNITTEKLKKAIGNVTVH